MRDYECFGGISAVAKALHGFLDSLQAHARLVKCDSFQFIFHISH